jgi:hypothetical protein
MSGHNYVTASYIYPDSDLSTLFVAGKFCNAEKEIKGWKEIRMEKRELFSTFHVAHHSVKIHTTTRTYPSVNAKTQLAILVRRLHFHHNKLQS